MSLQHSAALSFPPAQNLMISDIFITINTAEVEEEEKKSRAATKTEEWVNKESCRQGWTAGEGEWGAFT